MQPMPDLRVVSLEKIRRHEEVDPFRVGLLAARIESDGVQVNPMMCVETADGELVLLDGATRTEALKRLGLEHAAAQIVDGDQARLETWHHVIRGRPCDQVVKDLKAQPSVVMAEAGPTPRIHTVDGRCSSVVGDGLSPNAALSALVGAYIGKGRVSRTIDPSIERVAWEFPDWSVVVELPALTTADVAAAAVGRDLLPAGITRFLIDDRALRLNIDLGLLRSDRSRAEKQKLLDDLLEERAHAGRIRRYEEPVFVLDD